MNRERPILISVMQYEDKLNSGAMTVFDVIDAAQRLGADGVELRRELWPNWRRELVAASQWLEKLGLMATYATFVTLFSADNTDQSTLRQDIDAAAALGSPQLRVFQGPQPADADEAGWASARTIADYAAQRGIVLALENFARTPGGALAEIQRVLARVPHPALATNIDIGNYAGNNEDVVHAIRTLGARAASTHLKDNSAEPGEPATYLGGGVLPLDAIMAELDALPQRIIYCFEFRGGDDAEERITRSLEYLRRRHEA